MRSTPTATVAAAGGIFPKKRDEELGSQHTARAKCESQKLNREWKDKQNLGDEWTHYAWES
jgi:hypothetical protein